MVAMAVMTTHIYWLNSEESCNKYIILCGFWHSLPYISTFSFLCRDGRMYRQDMAYKDYKSTCNPIPTFTLGALQEFHTVDNRMMSDLKKRCIMIGLLL